MNKPGKTPVFLLALLVIGFAVGLYALFMLRLQTGDMYPAGSSLRTDPLGVKALFQALERIPGISVDRHYRALPKLAQTSQLTLFYLGLRPDFLKRTGRGVVEKMEELAKEGARVVISFQSGQKKTREMKWAKGPGKAEKKDPENARKEDEEGKGEEKEESIKAEPLLSAEMRWEAHPAYSTVPDSGEKVSAWATLKDPVEGLPPSFSVRTALYFQELGGDWRVLYSIEDRPVLIERSMGAGSIVLVADSYFFSNEAMLKERHSGLLSWLVGSGTQIVFDEYHLGVGDNPGIMTLIRKYRLHGFLAALILLAGLFAWQNAVPFIPPRARSMEKELKVAVGIDQMDGLVNLLKRNIGPGSLLRTCLEEWEKSVGQSGRGMPERIQQARGIVEAGSGRRSHSDVAKTYGEIADILSDRTLR